MFTASVSKVSAPVVHRNVAARAARPDVREHTRAEAKVRFVGIAATAALMLCAYNPAPAEAVNFVKSPTQKGAERVEGYNTQNARLQRAFEAEQKLMQKSSPSTSAQVCTPERIILQHVHSSSLSEVCLFLRLLR